ncbi:MAG: Asp-tRNA(Asn)/Glu-tRNA(Gln) amidotransferase subunit GatA [Candidatus Eisenbacteria bacterium]|nr:Asp-tRNA(Asn)/Glu-tRNA(Gln) amidotransferase subunit GatA [Candidatus Eisenbacteria bacterium]
MGICELSLREMGSAVARRKVSPAELVEAHLSRIRVCDPTLRAYVTVNEAECERLARDRGRQSGGPPGVAAPLNCIPIAVKDNICTKGLRTTCGSRILRNYVPPYDATAVSRLRDRGCLLIGKTNLDEFGMGSSTENSFFGPTRNPWDLERVPGGSSGGSAAAVAAGMAAAALGTDTGGSVRQPAALCGLVGYKPTYGVVSRRGLVAFASSLDQIGVIARTVEDTAAVLEAVSGWDAWDSTSARRGQVRARQTGEVGKSGVLRVGVPWGFFSEGLDPDVSDVTRAVVSKLEKERWAFEEIDLPHAEYSIAAYYLVADAEASSNLARYDGVRYGEREGGTDDLWEMYVRTRTAGLGTEVKRRVMLGTYALSAGYYEAYYLRAQKARTLIKRDYEEVLRRVDLVLMPTSPTAAFRLGEKLHDPLAMYLSDVFTVGVNLAGLPAVSLPSGYSRSGLPIGLQLIGRAFEDQTLLEAARLFEQVVALEARTPAGLKGLLESGRGGA